MRILLTEDESQDVAMAMTKARRSRKGGDPERYYRKAAGHAMANVIRTRLGRASRMRR